MAVALTNYIALSAVIFMITSLSLTILYTRGTHSRSVLSGTQTSAPAKTGK